MIEDVERGKAEIYDHLDSARRSPKKRVRELVELLEDKSVLTQKFGTLKISKNIKTERNRYSDFCKKYTIYVFNHFIFDEDDVEIMLVAFNYHPDFEYETRIKYRRDLFARQVYEPKHRRGWGDSVEDKSAGLREEETRIMKELSEVLAELAVAQGGTLGIVDEVLAEQESAEVTETVSPVLDDVEPDEPSETHTPSQLIPLMEVEQIKNFRQSRDTSKGALSPMPDVYVNNTADATNVTNVQVIVVIPETTEATTSTRKQPPVKPEAKTLAPHPRAKELPSLKPTPAPHYHRKKNFWLIILALIVVGLGVVYIAFSHLPDSKEPDNPAIVGSENVEPSSGITDPPDNSGPGNRVQADESDSSGHDIQIVENTGPGLNIQLDDPPNENRGPGLNIQFDENTGPGLNIQKDQE